MKYIYNFFVAVICSFLFYSAQDQCSDGMVDADRPPEATEQALRSDISDKADGSAMKHQLPKEEEVAMAIRVALANGGFGMLGSRVAPVIDSLVAALLNTELLMVNDERFKNIKRPRFHIDNISPYIWAGCVMLSQAYGNYLMNRSQVAVAIDKNTNSDNKMASNILVKGMGHINPILENGGATVGWGMIKYMLYPLSTQYKSVPRAFVDLVVSLGGILSQPLYNLCSYKVRKLYASYCAKNKENTPEAPVSAPSSV